MELLETVYGTFNVYINSLSSIEGHLFHVSFVDNKNKAHILLMQFESNRWRIKNPEIHAIWIVALEEQLDRLIQRRLSGDYVLLKAG